MVTKQSLYVLLCIFTLCNSAEQNKHSLLHDAAVGAVSSTAAMAVYTPCHYFQNRTIQNLPIDRNPRTWFRGFPALAGGKAPTMAVNLATYNLARTCLAQEDLAMQELIAATAAGALSGVVNNSTNLIALHQENTGQSLLRTITKLPARKTLTRGLGTTVSREILFTQLFLVALQNTKQTIKDNIANDTFATTIATTFASGAIIAGTTQPFMVVGAHLYADMEKKHYKNGVDAARYIFKKSGVKGFYTGAVYRSVGVMLAIPVLDGVCHQLNN